MAITLDGSDNKIAIGANATGPSYLRLYEDTDNGTHYVDIIAPATITSNRTLTLPDETGTVVTTATSTGLNASALSSGTVPDARFPATLPAASGANLTSLNASNLSSGTVSTARLGSGSATSSTFLRGDGTWAAASSTPSTSDVLSATSSATAGAVGTYAFLRNGDNSTLSFGSTVSATNLSPANAGGSNSGSVSGTWRCMGWTEGGAGNTRITTLFLRIS